MLKILVWGIGGRLGKMLVDTIKNDGSVVLAGGVDPFADPKAFDVPVFKSAADISVSADVIVDFSRHDSINDILPYSIENNLPAVICTTAHTEQEMDLIKEASKNIPIFKARNMSLGINLLMNLVKKAAAILGEKFDVEIIEQHHNIKADSPSGTALSIAEAINEVFDSEKEFVFGRHDNAKRRDKAEIGIHAVRGGTVVGKHEVLFMGNDEVITVSHEAQSKAVFCEASIKAAKFLVEQPAGLYNMNNLLEKA